MVFPKICFHDLLAWTNGPYGVTNMGVERYREICEAALAANVMLPPTQDSPIIIPSELSVGELARFLPVAKQNLGNE